MINYQRDNIERECKQLVRSALSYGMDANELRNYLADAWREECEEKGKWGHEAIAGRVIR